MSAPLGPRNLDELRRQAKELLGAANAGDSAAISRIESVSDRVTLAAAQLAIAREYAVVHGGRIELLQRSDGKHGAWFRLSLPLAAGAFSVKSAAAKPVTLAGIK